MISKKFIKALEIIYHKLKDKKIKWALAGSFALALRGIKIKPHDIDIVTDKKGAYRINKLLKEYELEPVKFRKTNKFASYFGKFNIGNVFIEVVGNFRQRLTNGLWTKPTSLKHREFIKFNNLKIPALSLNYEYKFYIKNTKDPKRLEKIKKIKKYLG